MAYWQSFSSTKLFLYAMSWLIKKAFGFNTRIDHQTVHHNTTSPRIINVDQDVLYHPSTTNIIRLGAIALIVIVIYYTLNYVIHPAIAVIAVMWVFSEMRMYGFNNCLRMIMHARHVLNTEQKRVYDSPTIRMMLSVSKHIHLSRHARLDQTAIVVSASADTKDDVPLRQRQTTSNALRKQRLAALLEEADTPKHGHSQ